MLRRIEKSSPAKRCTREAEVTHRTQSLHGGRSITLNTLDDLADMCAGCVMPSRKCTVAVDAQAQSMCNLHSSE